MKNRFFMMSSAICGLLMMFAVPLLGRAPAFSLKSASFGNGADIPVVYTCDGEDISPSLAWNDPPSGTRSFVLICDDPDAPSGTWTHWVLVNIAADIRNLPEGVGKKAPAPAGVVNGKNDFNRLGYGGPCPPSGSVHRYFFRLYALDRLLDCKDGVSRESVEKAMKGHILAEARWMGRYRRKSG